MNAAHYGDVKNNTCSKFNASDNYNKPPFDVLLRCCTALCGLHTELPTDYQCAHVHSGLSAEFTHA